MKVFEFPYSSWHSHEDCHKLTTGLYQKVCFSLQEGGYKQLPGERERFSCHATLSFCVFKSKVISTSQETAGLLWDGNWRGISAMCHLWSWNEPICTWVGAWAQSTRKAVKLPQTITFILGFFSSFQISFLCDPYFIWWFRSLADIADIMAC